MGHSLGRRGVIQLHSDTGSPVLIQSCYAGIDHVNIGRLQLPTIRNLHPSRKVKSPPSELWIQHGRIRQFYRRQLGLPNQITSGRVKNPEVELSIVRERGDWIRWNNRIRPTSIRLQDSRHIQAGPEKWLDGEFDKKLWQDGLRPDIRYCHLHQSAYT